MLPVGITNLVRVLAETTAAIEVQSNWSSSETVENRCFRPFIELTHKRAEPSKSLKNGLVAGWGMSFIGLR